MGGSDPYSGLRFQNGHMTSMYNRIKRDLIERVKLNGSGYLENLAENVLENLKFVQIILSQDEDPHQVFDSLNNRGQRLETIDLVRNEVFQKFDNDYTSADTKHVFGGHSRTR